MSVRELVTVVPLSILTLFLGLYPRFVLDMMDTSLKALVEKASGAPVTAPAVPGPDAATPVPATPTPAVPAAPAPAAPARH
jgi:hypothetical protein